MEMVPPKIIEEGVAAARKSSPSNAKNAVLGAMAGILLVCGYIALKVILNDSIQSEEDVMRYLSINVLASVPIRESDEQEGANQTGVQKKSRKKAKKRGGRL